MPSHSEMQGNQWASTSLSPLSGLPAIKAKPRELRPPTLITLQDLRGCRSPHLRRHHPQVLSIDRQAQMGTVLAPARVAFLRRNANPHLPNLLQGPQRGLHH